MISSMTRPLVACAAAALVLSGCLTPTPYHAASLTDRAHADGYREVRLETDRWRVTFAGNFLTSRETVETYLLYRAAELTLENGYDWFRTAERGTDDHTTLSLRQSGMAGAPGWAPRWRYAYGPRAVWQDWDRASPTFEVEKVTAYEAFAEVIMRRGEKPADDPGAFDARAVKASLEGRIQRPDEQAD